MDVGLFDRARAKVTIPDLLAGWDVKLARVGSELRGPCALCDGGDQRFAVKGEKFRCYVCEAHGDVVDLAQQLRRLANGAEAARWLLGEDIPTSAPRERREPAKAPEGPSASDRIAADIWAGVKPLEGSLAWKYLEGRGIARGVVAAASENLRYHPAAKHHWNARDGRWVRAPAMVAQVVTARGPTGGVHVTYLDRDTAGKAKIRLPDGSFGPAKKMWGPQRDAAGPGGAWLIGPDGAAATLAVAEGIETALSIVTLSSRRGVSLRACAALSLNRLQGGLAKDDDGCADPYAPVADPGAPAFVWPLPGAAPWDQVLIGVDRDMSDLRVMARTGRGKPCPMLLDGEARARICGKLAVAAWKATGAALVRAIQPPPRSDFNTELRRVLALESPK